MKSLFLLCLLPALALGQLTTVSDPLAVNTIPAKINEKVTEANAAFALKAPLASPTFTGTVTIPVTGSTQCLHVNTAGVISGTGSDCGAGGGGGLKRQLNGPGTAAKCQSGVAAAGFSLPVSNAPVAECESDNIQGRLAFPANLTTTAYDRFTLPEDWSGTLNFRLSAYSTSTSSVTVAYAFACLGTTAIASPTFGATQTMTFPPSAGSARTTVNTNVSSVVSGCAAGNLVIWRLAVTAAAAADFRVTEVRFTE